MKAFNFADLGNLGKQDLQLRKASTVCDGKEKGRQKVQAIKSLYLCCLLF